MDKDLMTEDMRTPSEMPAESEAAAPAAGAPAAETPGPASDGTRRKSRGRRGAAPAPAAPPAIGLDSPERLINRELSWLDFNGRVLEEADNPAHPLLERLRFLTISASNMDEFYMVRVAGLKGKLANNVHAPGPDGLTPSAQLERISARARELRHEQDRVFDEIRRELDAQGLSLVQDRDLTRADRAWLEDWFMERIFPALTPLTVDSAHPFPHLPNRGLVIAVALFDPDQDELAHGLVPIPAGLDSFLRLPGETGRRILPIERAIQHNLERLYPGMEVLASGVFYLLRDSDVEIEEDAEDLVRTFETMLRRRRRGRVIRLSVDRTMPAELRDFAVQHLQAEESDIFDEFELLDLSRLTELIDDRRGDLLFAPFQVRYPERIRDFGGDCFAAIRAKDFIIHRPYESFDVVVEFLRQAAQDPDVVAIKQTLYRTSRDSPIIEALVEAAEAGKTVTAVVELKARFDEEANIGWARQLERAGVQVVYGFVELKTHAKMSMVVRKEEGSLRTYAQFGTGNYNPHTARIYTDLSFFTCDPALGRDAARAFNFMTSYSEAGELEKLSMAPISLREDLLACIEAEIAAARENRPSGIWIKVNSLIDTQMIDTLYRASQAGVPVRIVARGICGLRPGLAGLSETIEVKSIVGRFLEHSRIFCFANGTPLPSQKARVYISSADLMPRNLDRRVEVMVPIENETVKRQLLEQVMATNLDDTEQSWLMQPDGSWIRARPADEATRLNAHAFFMTNPSLSGRGSQLEQARKARLIALRSRQKSDPTHN